MKHKKQEPQFSWNNEIGEATCILTDHNGQVFYATANCHPDDIDFMSEKTGCEIAYTRALIKLLQFNRDYSVKPGLAALKQLYYSCNKSKEYNKKSYEAKMLYKQIQNKEADLAALKEIIKDYQDNLRSYIKMKDQFYIRTRQHRKEKELEKANSN